jgi:hypothetical protein
MKRRRIGQRVTRVIMRLVGVFEASFRQIFGGFLNMEGFYTGFGRLFVLFIYQNKKKNSLGERLGFLSLRFPVSFPPLLSSSFFLFSVAFRESVSVNLESLSLSFKSFFWESLDSPRTA